MTRIRTASPWRIWLERLLWPLRVALVVGTLASIVIVNKHDFHATSPLFATREAAVGWEARLKAGPAARCLPDSVIDKTTATTMKPGWFVRFECHTSVLYEQIAVAYLFPFIAVLLFGTLLRARSDARR
ncbi:MAG: hypothetical protein INF91_05480 [Alphaproteobacteria bacterium]|nr:hypothetical protein [Alphaproteobacteria bacterium]